jgi:hypothetical protein
MKADMQALWEHTQQPDLHRQWDLRFSDIDYLPRRAGEESQRFLYRTRIGFGLSIAGTGETKATFEGDKGRRLSTLAFGSEQRLSLIRRGGGYWKYEACENGELLFATRFDYETRFGALGKWADFLLFRPLFGYATAWSFDRLRLWLEKGISPAASAEKAILHYSAVALLVLLWLYQGVVPKLLYPEHGELDLLRQTGWLHGWEEVALPLLGAAEAALAFLIGFMHRKRWVYKLQAGLLLALGMAAVTGIPELLRDPFNPLTLSLAMAGVGLAASRTAEGLPNAANCRRRPVKPNEKARRLRPT